ncbi:MAG TPA: aminoacyl-tRNA hydrolase [Candidatus Andersenbacteria bacterium]|nr:aminoacyl-tRNA hydrolase [Candidatus Andersenbacteria bacterium]
MQQFLLLGLGNPGEQFINTRHNLGADMLTSWIEYMRLRGATVSDVKTHEKFHARVCDIVFGDIAVSVLLPLLFMNESGKVLASYLRYNELQREHIVIVHDDLELPLGAVTFQATGSAHGHNGMRSVHEYIGEKDIPQLRIGIGRPNDATPIDTFVLGVFTPEEKKVLKEKESEIMEKITEVTFPSPHMGERA